MADIEISMTVTSDVDMGGAAIAVREAIKASRPVPDENVTVKLRLGSKVGADATGERLTNEECDSLEVRAIRAYEHHIASEVQS